MAGNTKLADLTVDSLKEEACRVARLNEWGDEDFQGPLEQFILSYKEKYGQGEDRSLDLPYRNALRTILVNRLIIRDNYKRYPEILREPLQRPLFIVGLPRTGSTLLHRLMSLDSSSRVLRYWEMSHPYYGTKLGLNHEELSIKLAELKIKEIYSRLPDLYPIHQIKAEEPEECNILMSHTFSSLYLASEWRLPRYAQWLVNQDITGSYRYYRKLLQLLFWHRPGRFMVLKCPSHLLNIRTIFTVFPDANILWLHRSPGKAIPSYLDLLSVFWGKEIENKNFIEFILDYLQRSLEKGIETEKETKPAQWLNLRYKELVENPAAGIFKIYNYFQYEIDSRLEENIRRWSTENPQHKHGVHTYSLEKFGISEAVIRERYARYYGEYGHLL